ncbi:tRNA (adenosine(37)-N6)-threonylcarbamoyltransferase complex dimerization subunit type 1 TsaB [Pokkaliibacter sp. CJK22405]|uniref:tRNA (adenosine(37)-N6)-threonylcarbamoyltransferase complex dimerization subunit type 1 TsaB n=1 Tax=Pokkaliibacter sp. CJK22405 TaxID=3384615 RepID=UPI0039853D68
MSLILALDASTEACSVSLLHCQEVIEDFQVIPRLHARRLLPMIEALIAQAGVKLSQLDAIAYGRGPGAFTGIRIAAGVAQGLAFAADKPLYAISTLQALAQGAYRETQNTHVLACIDARMGEIYVGDYVLSEGVMMLTGQEQVLPPEQCPVPVTADFIGWGTGWQFAEQFPASIAVAESRADALPHSQDLLPMALQRLNAGDAGVIEDAQPVYIRDQVTHGS